MSQTLSIRKSIDLARRAYLQRARKRVLEPLRTWFTVGGGASFYFMPAHVSGLRTVSAKIVSVKPRSHDGSLPTTSAMIYVFDSKTGAELARIAGNYLTAIRTAASSALATDILARQETETLGIIGTGKQAQAHLPTMLAVRDFSQVLVYSRSKAHRSAFVRGSKKIGVPVTASSSAEELARKSDVLVLATNSRVPVLHNNAVSPGTHVNAIGAALPSSREMDSTLVKRSVLVVDSVNQALASYGDILIPIKERLIRKSHIRAELGELLLDPTILQRSEVDITVFKAGGLAALDAVFADHVVSRVSSILGN